MTTPKVNTIKRGDTRFYVSPDSGKKAPGVTSILNMIPKPFLTFWAAKMVADEFVADPGTAVSLAIRNPSAAVDRIGHGVEPLVEGRVEQRDGIGPAGPPLRGERNAAPAAVAEAGRPVAELREVLDVDSGVEHLGGEGLDVAAWDPR